MNYVLITPARNEEAVIRRTLESVVAQTQPARCGGSSSTTVRPIARRRSSRSMRGVTRGSCSSGGRARADRNFAGKVACGQRRARGASKDLRVRGDRQPGRRRLVRARTTWSSCCEKFARGPEAGRCRARRSPRTAGTIRRRDSFEGENYVAGPCQLFRYECFRDIGGYVPNPAGGVDWIAVMTARMKGWTVTAFPEKRFHHHRSMGTAERGDVAALFSYGEKDYYLGGSPVWQLVSWRLPDDEAAVRRRRAGAACWATRWAALRRVKRPVTPELMRFHRREQMRKLRAVLFALARFKRPGRVPSWPQGRSARLSDARPVDADARSPTCWLDSPAGSTPSARPPGITRASSPARSAGAPRRSTTGTRLLGTLAVAPMIFCEAFLPSARRLFHEPMRFPIADAHYAMGFAYLYQATRRPTHI